MGIENFTYLEIGIVSVLHSPSIEDITVFGLIRMGDTVMVDNHIDVKRRNVLHSVVFLDYKDIEIQIFLEKIILDC